MSKATAAAARASNNTTPASRGLPPVPKRTNPNVPTEDMKQAFPTTDLSSAVTFCAIGDFGDYHSNEQLAAVMGLVVAKTKKFDNVLNLGDDFYPRGPTTAEATAAFARWRARFASGELSGIPWRKALGNHCTQGDYKTSLDFSDSPDNPQGAWQMRGHPLEQASSFYTWFNEVRFPGRGPQPASAFASSSAAAAFRAQQEQAVATASAAAAATATSSSEPAKKPEPQQQTNASENSAQQAQAAAAATAASTTGAAPAAAASSASSPQAAPPPPPRPSPTTTSIAFAQSPAAAAAAAVSYGAPPPAGAVHFTAINTVIASTSQHNRNRWLVEEWPQQMVWLHQQLRAQTNSELDPTVRAHYPAAFRLPPTLFKIVFGHHPCYCVGKGHNPQAMCLRAKRGKQPPAQGSIQAPAHAVGLGLGPILKDEGVDLYIAGHEHVCWIGDMDDGICHAVSGAGAEALVYGGKIAGKDGHRFEYCNTHHRSFLVGCITADKAQRTATLTLSIISVDAPVGSVLFTKSIVKSIDS